MPRPHDASPGDSLHPALAAWMLAVAATVAGVLASSLALASGDPVSWKALLLPALWSLPGALIAAGRPRIAVGWLLLAVAVLFAGSGLAEAWVRYGDDTGRAAAVWFVDRFSAVLIVCTALALLLLPDGRLPSRRWGPLVTTVVAGQLLLVAAWVLARGPAAAPDSTWPSDVMTLGNPVGVLPREWGDAVAGLDWLLQLPLLLCVAAVVSRIRRVDAAGRALVLVLLALAVFVIVVVGGRTLGSPVADVLDVGASVLLASALVAAVLRRHLEGVAVVVHHAFVYAVLGLGVALAYMSVAGLLSAAGSAMSPFGAGVVAAGAALAVNPVRHRLQRLVDRMMHGDRRDPYAAVARLAEGTHRAPSPQEVLAAVAASVAKSLRVPYVRVEAFGEVSEQGSSGRGAPAVRAPLVAGDTELGSLVVAPQEGRRLGADERALLRELGRHAGIAVDAVRLAAEVAEHHRQVVAAREEERRRLGRELHDGLGPTVAGLAMQLGALRSLVHTDPGAAVARLARLEALATEALAGIRRVAYELRPPVLDQIGLARAVAQAAESLDLVVQQDASGDGPLPAAVELAAYRIAVEALSNVARHAGVRTARVSIRAAGGILVVVVADDGTGPGADGVPGLGIAGMRERAEEVGGTLSIRPGERQGTTVTAVLPLDVPVEAVR